MVVRESYSRCLESVRYSNPKAHARAPGRVLERRRAKSRGLPSLLTRRSAACSVACQMHDAVLPADFGKHLLDGAAAYALL